MEGLFLSHLIKVMRSTAQASESGGMPGKGVMGDYADMELGRVLAERQSIGLADLLYRSMAQRQETKGSSDSGPGQEASAPGALSRPDAVRAPIPLERAVGTNAAPVAAPRALSVSRTKSPKFYDLHVQDAARRYKLNPRLIHSVIAVESGGNPRAESPKSAKGLMQLTDSTAAMLGVEDVWDPKENIYGGAHYLRSLLDRFDGDLTLAVAAYNAGPGAVERHGGVPPYPETQNYVRRVLDSFMPRTQGDPHGL